jgi:hypothetical protein
MVGAIRAITFRIPGFPKAFPSPMKPKRKPLLSTEGSWQSACSTPPKTTPTAMARAGLSMYGATKTGTAMKQRLKRMGAKPVGVNTLTLLRMPWRKEATETRARKGNMIRVRTAVS